MSLGNYERYAHRCSVAIALYQKYCGLGIGREMLKTVLTMAKQCGYEQAELEVVSTNTPAIRLYESLGFEIWGTQPHSVRYRDGSYADRSLYGEASGINLRLCWKTRRLEAGNAY